jgi:hypothetical protein
MTSQKRPDDLPRVLEELEQFIAGSENEPHQADGPFPWSDDGDPSREAEPRDRRVLTDRRRRPK